MPSIRNQARWFWYEIAKIRRMDRALWIEFLASLIPGACVGAALTYAAMKLM